MGLEFGICVHSGSMYEHVRGYWHEIWPRPAASSAAFVSGPESRVQIIPLDRLGGMVFREDSFDATTRIRRGRLYKCAGNIKPEAVFHHLTVHTLPGARPQAQLHHFTDFQPKPTVELVAIGDEDSLWRILGAERISTGEWLVTLKARGGAGLLPEVDDDKVPALGRAEVVRAVDHMVDVAHRETPGSIVDVARNTAALLMGVYAAGLETVAGKQREIRHKDLSKVCTHFESHPKLKKQEVAISTGRILARLHPRNKLNEQQRYNLRPITEEDATFAVSAIGLLLNEFTWTYEAATGASPVADAAANP